MVSLFTWIFEVLGIIWDYFVSSAERFFSFIAQIVEGFTFVMSVIAVLPPFCKGALLAIVSLSVITMFLSIFIDVG